MGVEGGGKGDLQLEHEKSWGVLKVFLSLLCWGFQWYLHLSIFRKLYALNMCCLLDDNCISTKLFLRTVMKSASQLPVEIVPVLFKLSNYPTVRWTLRGNAVCSSFLPPKPKAFFPLKSSSLVLRAWTFYLQHGRKLCGQWLQAHRGK